MVLVDMILLNAQQADHVRGPTAPGSALEPIPHMLGMFVLPTTVLNDPAHAQHHQYLNALPRIKLEVDL